MSIEAVVKRLTAVRARARCLSGYPYVYGVNGVDLQALLDAYREATGELEEQAERHHQETKEYEHIRNGLIEQRDAAWAETEKVEVERDAARAEVELLKAEMEGIQRVQHKCQAAEETIALLKEENAQLKQARAEVAGLKARCGTCNCDPETPHVFECKLGCDCGCHALWRRNEGLEQENDRMETEIATKTNHLDLADAEIYSLKLECTRLEKENARLKQAQSVDVEAMWDARRECGNLTDKLTRSQELLASTRAQSESHLQARLEAERTNELSQKAWLNAEKAHERVFKMTCAMADSRGALKDRFRRLAKRYLGLRAKLEAWKENSDGWQAECELLKGQRRVFSFCVECGPNLPIDEDGCCETCGSTAVGEHLYKLDDRAQAAEAKVAKLEGYLATEVAERNKLWLSRKDERARAAELQKRLDEGEEVAQWRLDRLDTFEKALRHTESIAMGTAFELGRALEFIRILSLHIHLTKSEKDFLASFASDAPTESASAVRARLGWPETSDEQQTENLEHNLDAPGAK